MKIMLNAEVLLCLIGFALLQESFVFPPISWDVPTKKTMLSNTTITTRNAVHVATLSYSRSTKKYRKCPSEISLEPSATARRLPPPC